MLETDVDTGLENSFGSRVYLNKCIPPCINIILIVVSLERPFLKIVHCKF